MAHPVPASDPAEALRLAALRPSEYTAALIHALQARADRVRGGAVLEIGSGSGVVLAALGALGAASLCGIDIEEDAVDAGMLLLAELGHGAVSELHQGDMWLPVAGRRFDLIVANLPHFPMERHEVLGRRPTWSAGGNNGRALLDRFLEGLDAHLLQGGCAVVTHNAFVGMDRTREMLRARGMTMAVVQSILVGIPDEKMGRMTPSVLAAELGRTLHRFGPYCFGEVNVLEIARIGARG
ncbi:MAG: methyltransferase domain-containing protein [Proteobacteria bacterium]|nr:methyltransferase domain-containing protein [Pseudomonadota bacterium]